MKFFNKGKTREQKAKKASTLYKLLKNSYQKKHSKQKLKPDGLILDKSLSNHNQQVYYNPIDNKVVVAVAGTHNFSDIVTDMFLLTGNLKHTSRYLEAEEIYTKAIEKYNPRKSIVVGHSLGASIASGIAENDDDIITYNKGAYPGQKHRENETSYRTRGDLISLFAAPKSIHLPFTINKPHNLKHIKRLHVKI